MNLILLADSDRVEDNTYRLADHRADHIRTVLRVVEGDRIQVGIINGPAGTARISRLTNLDILLTCEALAPVEVPAPAVQLICALPRPQTLKKVLFTSGMMGVQQLHFIRANRVEKSYFHSPLLKVENYTPFLIEGLSQGKLTRLPQVCFHDRFKPFFEDILPTITPSDTPTLRLLPDSDSDQTLGDLIAGIPSNLTIAIGPEGGWVPFELEFMSQLGFRSFTLGRWTLRVEHAVTAALSQIELLRMTR